MVLVLVNYNSSGVEMCILVNIKENMIKYNCVNWAKTVCKHDMIIFIYILTVLLLAIKNFESKMAVVQTTVQNKTKPIASK